MSMPDIASSISNFFSALVLPKMNSFTLMFFFSIIFICLKLFDGAKVRLIFDICKDLSNFFYLNLKVFQFLYRAKSKRSLQIIHIYSICLLYLIKDPDKSYQNQDPAGILTIREATGSILALWGYKSASSHLHRQLDAESSNYYATNLYLHSYLHLWIIQTFVVDSKADTAIDPFYWCLAVWFNEMVIWDGICAIHLSVDYKLHCRALWVLSEQVICLSPQLC
jgi:hypothetical protein